MLEAIDKVARFFPELTVEDTQKRRPSGNALTWRNTVQWTRLRLVRKGELDKSVRGVWAITNQGKARLGSEWESWKPTEAGQSIRSSRNLKLVAQKSLVAGLVSDESDLWGLVLKWVDKNWGEDARREGDEYWVKNTALKARKGQLGKWSRPDVASVQVSRFEVLPHRTAEITTFEVKRFQDAQRVTGVYEAAAHQRWSHHAYLVAEVPSRDSLLPEDVLSEARRFGVGVLLAAKGEKADEFELRAVLDPQRQEPSPKNVDSFLKDFFAGDEKELRRLKDSLK